MLEVENLQVAGQLRWGLHLPVVRCATPSCKDRRMRSSSFSEHSIVFFREPLVGPQGAGRSPSDPDRPSQHSTL